MNKRCVSPAHLLAVSPAEHREYHPRFQVVTKKMSPEEARVARNARGRILARERRRRDPEGVRAKERLAQQRLKEKDPEGYRARRRGHSRRSYQRKRSRETGGGVYVRLRMGRDYEEEYRLKRAAMSLEQIKALNARQREVARERMARDPEGERAKAHAGYVRGKERVARDYEGFLARLESAQARGARKEAERIFE